jgi:acetolactate synthase-1/2/3 large subunit
VAAQENCFPMMPAGHGHHRVMLGKDRWYQEGRKECQLD